MLAGCGKKCVPPPRLSHTSLPCVRTTAPLTYDDTPLPSRPRMLLGLAPEKNGTAPSK